MKKYSGSEISGLLVQALKQTGEGIALTDLSGNIICVNRAFAETHGYTEEELVGKTLTAFHRSEDMPFVIEISRQVMETGSFSGEVFHLHSDGHVFPVLMHSSLVRDSSGRPAGVIKVMREITGIKKGIRELEEAKQLLQSVLDAIPDVLGIQNLVHEVLRYNASGYKFLGVTPDGIKGKKCYELIGHSRPCDVCATSETYTTLKSARVEKYVPELGKWLDARSYPILDENGELVRVIEHLRDITEAKEAENRHRKLEEQMKVTQKLESLGVMAGGIAHDFNNILMSVLGKADLALREENLPPAAANYLSDIVKAAERAAELADLMLDYSGQSEPNKAPLNMNRLIEDTGQILRVSVSKKTELICDLYPKLPPVVGDSAQLRQVVMNLITNASESLEGGKGTVTLSTRLVDYTGHHMPRFYLDNKLEKGQYIVVTVSDTGSGMDRATLSRMFDPFFTTKFTGRGLGLAAVLGIVRAHSGGITVDSVPGGGTMISVFLPVSGNTESPAESRCSIIPETGTGCILVVDDEESVRSVTAGMIKKLGFDVAFAADGRQAVDAVKKNPGGFLCIIMDLTMPEMDGFEAFERIVMEDPPARIIISSGFSRDTVMKRFSGRNLGGFLHKPYSIDEVALAVKRAACGSDGP